MTIEFDRSTSEGDPTPTGRPERRALAVLGAAMLVAAAGGVGFGIGRAAGGDAAITPGDAPGPESSLEPPAPATLPPLAPTGPTSRDAAAADAAATTGETIVLDESANGDFVSGGGGWTVFGGEQMTLLTKRTTETGITLRAHLGRLWEQGDMEQGGFGGPDGWTPPPWCFESGQVRVAIAGGADTGTSVIDVGSVGWWTEPYDGRAVSALTMGLADENPYRVVFVQAPTSVTAVTVTFGDGATDSVTPTDGVALLAVPGAGPESDVYPGAPPTDFVVTFDDATAESTTFDGTSTGYDDPGYQASCSPPPPELPAPGEQPADPAAAEATITDLMATIYGDAAGDGDADNADRIDDPTGVAEAREQVRSGGFEDAAASAEAVVEELVFTSPTEAWFRYRIDTDTNGSFLDRFGVAIDVDGTWKITRDTICQDLSLAGGDCGGIVEMVRPPGADQAIGDD